MIHVCNLCNLYAGAGGQGGASAVSRTVPGPLPPPPVQSSQSPAAQTAVQSPAVAGLRRYWDEDSLVSPLSRAERSVVPGHSLPASHQSNLLLGSNSFSLGKISQLLIKYFLYLCTNYFLSISFKYFQKSYRNIFKTFSSNDFPRNIKTV